MFSDDETAARAWSLTLVSLCSLIELLLVVREHSPALLTSSHLDREWYIALTLTQYYTWDFLEHHSRSEDIVSALRARPVWIVKWVEVDLLFHSVLRLLCGSVFCSDTTLSLTLLTHFCLHRSVLLCEMFALLLVVLSLTTCDDSVTLCEGNV